MVPAAAAAIACQFENDMVDEFMLAGDEAVVVGSASNHVRKQSVKRRKKRSSKLLSEILANDDEDEMNRKGLDGDDECSFSSTTTAKTAI